MLHCSPAVLTPQSSSDAAKDCLRAQRGESGIKLSYAVFAVKACNSKARSFPTACILSSRRTVRSAVAGAKAAASDSTMPDPTAAKYDYAEGLHKTLIFFESMRSGVLDRQRLAW